MPDNPAHFDRLYQSSDDPWNYRSSAYEKQKYDATCAALTRPHYLSGIEAGCSIGILTARLAQRCTSLIGLDSSPKAVELAQNTLRPFPGTKIIHALLPGGWPAGRYDLIMLSEIIYYLPANDIVTLAQFVARDAVRHAECVLVQWRGQTETEVTAATAMAIFCDTASGLRDAKIIDHPVGGNYDHRTMVFV